MAEASGEGRRGAGPGRWAAGLATALPWLALAFILAWLLAGFARRVGYPYDLEWMEGGMLAQAWRVEHGLPLYTAPSADYVPFIYPPLYPWLLGGLGRVVGLGYALGRSLSLAGTLIAAAVLVGAVAGERPERRAGLAWGAGAAALFLSTYEDAGSFFDLVRVDGVFIALLAGALLAVRHDRPRLGGLLLVAAFAAKHNAAVFGLPALLWLARFRGRAAARRFAAWSVGPALAFLLAMRFEGDGLFLTYLLGVPAHHRIVGARLFPGAEKELILAMPLVLAVALAVGVASWRRRTPGAVYWVAQGITAVVVSAFMRGHHGGYLNVLIPGLWALALLSALAFAAAAGRWPRARLVLALVLAGQVVAGRWRFDRYLPTEADRAAGDALVEKLAAIDGDVLAPWSPWYPVLAGHPPSLHLIALWDIDHEGGPLRGGVARVREAMEARRWAAVLVANDRFDHGLRRAYRKAETLRYRGRAFYPKTGWPVRPRAIYLPRNTGPR